MRLKKLNAGADEVGFEELADKVKSGFTDFDVVIATPDSMRIVGQLGQVLGPKGLMPNPKVGTVTPDVEKAVDNVKKGQVQFRSDKGGILHCIIGKLSFQSDDLLENMKELIAVVSKLRPANVKGIFLKKISLSSTMGPGLTVDVNFLSNFVDSLWCHQRPQVLLLNFLRRCAVKSCFTIFLINGDNFDNLKR